MNLRLDWCSHKAAKYAVEHWHYSKAMPAGKMVKIGVWEDNVFVGCILFSRGANNHIGRPYNLKQTEVVELTRIALTAHKTPVSRLISIALKFLRRHCPNLRLVVSYADVDQNHHGGIYQATNWVFEGLKNKGTCSAFIIKGRKTHPRSVGAKGGKQSISWIRKNIDPNATVFRTRGKYKYLMPLDKNMGKQIDPLRKPYPKKCGGLVEGEQVPPVLGGLTPTPSLQIDG
jgi:hypothetical protein